MTKVVEIKLDRDNLIAGIIPRISFVDRPSYMTSTREYDIVSAGDKLGVFPWEIPPFTPPPYPAGLQVPWLCPVSTADWIRCVFRDLPGTQRMVLLHSQHELRVPAHVW